MGRKTNPKASQAIALLKRNNTEIASWIPRTVLGSDFNAQWFIGFANRQIEKLAATSHDFNPVPASAVTALVTFAMAGLMPNPALGHGYLVPFRPRDKNFDVITPVFGYRGLQLLARRADSQDHRIRAFHMGTICEGDVFDESLPTEAMIRHHRPAPSRSNADFEALVYAYSQIRVVDRFGDYFISELTPRGQVELVRDKAASKKGPWATYPLAMAAKTSLRRQLTSGAVAIEPLAGMALAAEGAAEGRRYTDMRTALTARPDVPSQFIDEAAAEVAEEMAIDADSYEAPLAEPPAQDERDATVNALHEALNAAKTMAEGQKVLVEINKLKDSNEKAGLFAHYRDCREHWDA